MAIHGHRRNGRRDEDDDDEAIDVKSTRSVARPPPDGGWGWVVVFASFMIHLVADGVTYTFGIFFVQFVRYYEAGYASTSFIASILVGTTLCCGPVASALTNRYGCRAITIAGAIVATIGFVSSLWAPNVTTLYFTIGLCVGIGFGLIYLPAIVSVTCYFERWRAFATGIAVCGSGLGTFLLAPLIEHLTVQVYGWKGAMLIVAGLCLNCAVFGALFRSPDADARLPVKRKRPAVVRLAKPVDVEAACESLGPTKPKFGDEGRIHPQVPSPGVGGIRRSVTAQGQLAPDDDGDIDDDNNQIKRSKLVVWSTLNLAVVTNEGSERVGDVLSCGGGGGVTSSLLGRGPGIKPIDAQLSGPLYRKDIFYGGSLLNIPQYRSNPSMYTASVIHIPAGFSPATSRPTNDGRRSERKLSHSDANSSSRCCSSFGGCLAREVRDALAQMTDISLLNDHVFLLFAISNFLTSIGFNVPYVYIKDRALLLGVSGENSSFLLAIIGVSNTVSRVVLGYLSDKPWVNRLWLYSCSLTICGAATAMSSLCLDYASLVLYATVFGATAGAYVGLTSVILVDLLGLEKLTNAFGLLLLFQGFASLIGPPIAGWLYDSLKSYDPGFYVAGATIAVSGLMLFAIPLVRSMADEDGSPPVTIESGVGSEDDEEENEADIEDKPLEMIISKVSSPAS